MSKRYLNFLLFIALHSEEGMTSFLTSHFWQFYTLYKKTRVPFEILIKVWARKMCYLCKLLIWKFDIIWPDLFISFILNIKQTFTWNPSKVKFADVIGSNDHHWRYQRAKWPRKLVPYGMLVTFILLTFLWHDLDLDHMTLRWKC